MALNKGGNNMQEIKIRTNERVKNRIIMMSKERGISMNQMIIYLLELGLYQLLEEEKDYAKIHDKRNKEIEK